MRCPELEKFLANFSESMMDAHDSLETVRAKMARIHPRDHGPDTVCDDATAFVARAAHAGRQVLLDVNAGHVHGLHGQAGLCPESDRAMERVGEFVRTYIP